MLRPYFLMRLMSVPLLEYDRHETFVLDFQLALDGFDLQVIVASLKRLSGRFIQEDCHRRMIL